MQNKKIEKENATQIDHEYKVRDYVSVIEIIGQRSHCKLASPAEGLYVITAIHANGNMSILCKSYEKHIDICRLKPYNNNATHNTD